MVTTSVEAAAKSSASLGIRAPQPPSRFYHHCSATRRERSASFGAVRRERRGRRRRALRVLLAPLGAARLLQPAAIGEGLRALRRRAKILHHVDDLVADHVGLAR